MRHLKHSRVHVRPTGCASLNATSWNTGAERLYGYTAEEAIGKPTTILISSDKHNEEPAILERIKRGEHVQHYETVPAAQTRIPH
jgi:PAS domain S-box-containing protein